VRFSLNWPCQPNERFAPTAFDTQIGSTITVNTATGTVEGVLIGAAVTQDGSSVELTIDAPVESTNIEAQR